MDSMPVDFQGPIWNAVFTFIGALILWCREGPGKLKIYYFSEIVDRLPLHPNARYFIQLLLFLTVGTIVGLALTQPVNPRQAITAGLAWTALFSKRV